MNWKKSTWIGLLVIFLTGCGPLRVLHRDPAFNSGSFRAGGVGVGGVTRLDSTGYYAERPVAGVLTEHLKDQFPGLKIVPLQEFETLVTPEKRTELLELFREAANVPPAAYDLLEPVAPHVRYVLLIDILEEEAPNFEGVSAQRMGHTIRHPVTGERYIYNSGVRYTSTRGSVRYIRAIMTILDLQERKLVYSVEGASKQGFANSASDIDWVPRVGGTGIPAPSDLFEELGEQLASALRKL